MYGADVDIAHHKLCLLKGAFNAATDTSDHIECSNRKPLDFEDSRPRSYRQFWIMRNLQSEFGHTGRMDWIELGCTCAKRNDTYSMCEWRRLGSACAFDTPLASYSNVLEIYFVYLKH